MENDYIECAECGHPLERHSTAGCDFQDEGCTCRDRWTVREVERLRREAGLTVKFKRWEH